MKLFTFTGRQPAPKFTRHLFMKPYFLLFLLISAGNAFSQVKESVMSMTDTVASHQREKNAGSRPSIKPFIVPVALITYGFIARDNDNVFSLNKPVQKQLRKDGYHTQVDDFLQYAPGVMVYGLNLAGIKGKNNFRDRTVIYLLSNLTAGIIAQSLKAITRVERPYGTDLNAFPSGHTATAFTNAYFLHQEYKHRSHWYGVAGYAMATTTGLLRIANNAHWFSDVVAGAGVGIVSTEIIYRLYPKIRKWLFRDKPGNTVIMPGFQNNSFGVSLITKFR